MTQTYSIQTIAKELQALQLPFPDFLARALTALMTARKATLQQIAILLPGSTDPEAKRQELRRFLDQLALGNGAFARAIDKLLPKGAWTLAMIEPSGKSARRASICWCSRSSSPGAPFP